MGRLYFVGFSQALFALSESLVVGGEAFGSDCRVHTPAAVCASSCVHRDPPLIVSQGLRPVSTESTPVHSTTFLLVPLEVTEGVLCWGPPPVVGVVCVRVSENSISRQF